MGRPKQLQGLKPLLHKLTSWIASRASPGKPDSTRWMGRRRRGLQRGLESTQCSVSSCRKAFPPSRVDQDSAGTHQLLAFTSDVHAVALAICVVLTPTKSLRSTSWFSSIPALGIPLWEESSEIPDDLNHPGGVSAPHEHITSVRMCTWRFAVDV